MGLELQILKAQTVFRQCVCPNPDFENAIGSVHINSVRASDDSVIRIISPFSFLLPPKAEAKRGMQRRRNKPIYMYICIFVWEPPPWIDISTRFRISLAYFL